MVLLWACALLYGFSISEILWVTPVIPSVHAQSTSTMKVVLGHTCNETKSCLTSNSECFNSTCKCLSTHYQNISRCETRIGAGQRCVSLQDGTSPCVRHAVCINSRCQCPRPSEFAYNNKCVKFKELRAGADCSGANSYQCPTGSMCQADRCVCTAPLVEDPAAGLCKLRVGGYCSGANSYQCPPGSMCHADRCVCRAPVVQDPATGLCKLRVGGDCSGANSDTCATGSECFADRCVCTPPLVPDPATGLCSLSFLPFGSRCELSLSHVKPCANGIICIQTANETTPKCGCHQDHYFNGERCVGRVPAMFACNPAGSDMTLSQDPCLPNASCHHRTHVCLCDAGYSLTGGRCLATSELIGK